MKRPTYEQPRDFALRKFSRQEKTAAGPPEVSSSTTATKTILIVDDRPANRRLLCAMLMHLGHRLLEADTGAKALRMVRKERPDLIIADILMPKMHGYEFVRKLRRDRKIAHTSVVFFTARYLEAESRKLAKVCGVQHLIVKPVRWEEVDKIVNAALGTRPQTTRPLKARDVARKHLDLITAKLADKVGELEELNVRLQMEVAERKRVVEELQVAHEEAHCAREDAERANSAKDHFLATLSHELRTPLTPVLMCVTALEQEESFEPELRAQLGMIRRNIMLEARLIDDLLDLTAIAQGKVKLVRSGAVDIHSLLAQTEQIVESDARQKCIRLEFDLTAAEHHVDGEAARLHQVFWNLIKNSIKFTPRGGRVTVRTSTPVPGQFVLTVEDTGEGITAKTLPVIFNAFEQGETREAPAPGGLGLGLAISHAIIELHGGIISAESAGPGLGSIFTVQLATVLPFSGAQAPETRKSRQFQSGVRRLRLLVIEDHEPTMEVLARLLRSQGHDVLTACTVNVALSLAAGHSFDLVISDLGLPDGSGLDLMQQLAKEYGLRGIALSGYGMPQDRVNTQQAGFLAHLVKPINFEKLHQVLQEIAPTVEPTAISEASG